MFSSKEDLGLIINVMSFGFKYGLPMDSDLVFDVRFLPNPFYIPELKENRVFKPAFTIMLWSLMKARNF